MRQLTDAARLREFMRMVGRRTRAAGRVHLVGGACAACACSTAVLWERIPDPGSLFPDLRPHLWAYAERFWNGRHLQ